jgi:hypothetical protein
MAACVVTLRCYRGVVNGDSTVTRGAQVGGDFVTTIPSAGTLTAFEATFIDALRPNAGTYVITTATDGQQAIWSGTDVNVLTVGA